MRKKLSCGSGSLSANQSKVGLEILFLVMDLSHGEWSCFFFVMDKDMNEVVVPNFKNTHVEMQD